MIGQSWYGAWSHCRRPDFAGFHHVVGDASPLIALLVGELHLRERIADHLSSAATVHQKYCRATGNCEINSSIGLIPDPALHR
jgi:hypothetical protein